MAETFSPEMVEQYLRGEVTLEEATERIVRTLGPDSGFGYHIPLEAAATPEAVRIAELTHVVWRAMAKRLDPPAP